jgi:hypothetical protein
VVDHTGTLNPTDKAVLEAKLSALETAKGSQVVVLVVATTQPEDIAAYAWRVADTWKIGRKDVGDGVLLIVALNDRRVRIEVARALEGAIPDLAASRIIEGAITPAFRDAEPMEISDYIDEDLISNAMTKFKGQALKVSSAAGTPNVLTPDRFKVFLHERMRIWDTVLDYTQGAETDIKAGRTVAEQNAQDTCRLDVGYPFRPVFGAHVIAIRKDFTTPDIV